ncbi:hypothetical protein CSA80_04705 [Candidatus Saccharibacteria bacterium]|nr:MAG: hypothetical protein CSA80_04705 [Candidatus Saccharibacteria bacterium]
MSVNIDEQFVEYVVKSLVNYPEEVKIDRRVDEKGVLLELTVHPEDLGRVIGKRGATAQSIRTLLRALGTKQEARYNLKIVDVDKLDENNQAKEQQPAATAPVDDAVSTDDADDSALASAVSDAADETQEEDAGGAPEQKPAEERRESDTVARTRAELADLDDLDI